MGGAGFGAFDVTGGVVCGAGPQATAARPTAPASTLLRVTPTRQLFGLAYARSTVMTGRPPSYCSAPISTDSTSLCQPW
jgi:hypothetical protein